MKKSGFRKLNFLIAIGGIFAALALGGCENLLSSTSSSNDSAPVNFFPPAGNVENGYGIVRGVLPQNVSASTRSAMPSTAAISSYRVFAQNGSTTIEASVDNSNGTFLVSLPYGTWNITANGLLANGRVIFTQTQRIVVSTSELNVSLKLGYSTNPDDGEGEMSLTVKFPPSGATSTITGIEYTLTKGGNSKTVAVDSADVAAGTFTIERTTEDLGTYNLTIKCYGDFNNLVYRIDEIVNVYANLTTDKFVGSAPYISGGDIVITQAMLDEFQQATLYVNATIGNDSNNGTQFDPLRTFNRAVELVNNSTRPADTEFRIFLQSDVVDGAELELKAGKKLTVANAGNTIHTITSLNGTFTVAATSTLTAQSMQFQKVRFMVNGTFEMNGGTISGNEVNSNGGAIYVKAGGQATISNGATISGNTTSLNGGGVYVDSGTFTMTGGEISDNTATEAGGAIYIKAGGQATITDGATISGNTATGGNGGGILNIGTLAITDSTISNCTTGNAGSGICNSTMSASASITNCTISGCRGSTSSTYGGGIYVGGGTLSLDGCTIGGDSENDGCTAKNGGGINIDGGTLTFTGSTTTIKNCTATTFGGGIYINTSTAISNCTIESCKITATSGTVGGGGIYNAGGTAAAPVTITGCTIKQCTSETQGFGGGIYNAKVLAISGGEISGCTAKSLGGGIYNTSGGTLTMEGGTITGCTTNSGGGIYINSGTLSLDGCTIGGDSADDGCTAAYGGGIYVYSGTLTISGNTTTIKNCTATYTAAGISIYNRATATISNCTISDNITNESGGGVFVGGTLTMKVGTTISGNTATKNGSGVHVSAGTFTMDGGTISDNIANESGGGVYAYNSTFTMNDGTISGNISRGTTEGSFGGGGIYIYHSTASASGGVFTMTGGTVSGNEAVYGGGIWGSNFSEISLEGGTFSGNTAATSGQGAYVSPGCTFKMSGAASLVSNNGDNDVYLHGVKNSSTGAVMSYATICVAGALTATSPVATITPAIYEVDQAVLSADTGLTITPTICSSFAMSSAPAGMEELGIAPDGTGTKGILKQSTLYVRGSGAGWYADNLAYIASAGNDANSGSKSAPFATIQKAIEMALAMNDGASEYTIWVDGTITGGATATANGMGDISPTKALNLKIQSMSATTNATLDAEGNGRVLNINANAAVTLKNVNITNGTTADNGGGIYNSGMLTITGGTIENCTAAEGNGGGIYNSGTLTIEGGSITNCTANTSTAAGGWGGGICNDVTDATITCTLTDCTITGCKATSSSGYGWGGGICNKAGTLKLTNVNITGGGDTASPDASSGGGIYNAGTLTIEGDSTISACVVRHTGGGVCVVGGTFTMKSGAISGNDASQGFTGGGGVYLSDGTFIMEDGKIENNIAKGRRGGGVDVENNTASFIMKGGIISGNVLTARDQDYSHGGGVCNTGAFTMEGGIISGNSNISYIGSKELSGGVFAGRTFKMGGSAFIPAGDDGTNDLYVSISNTNGTTIALTSLLTTDGIVATIRPYKYELGAQVLSLADGSTTTIEANYQKFKMAEEGWEITKEGKLALSDIYVNAGTGDNTKGVGTRTKPFATLQKAFDLLAAGTDENASYTIHVSGTVTGGSTLDAGVKAKKILITGETGADTDILDGGGTAFCVLNVNGSVPVEIKNIKITNPQGQAGGGRGYGIRLYESNVTLGEGAVVSGGLGGAGVYIAANSSAPEACKFTMTGGEIISYGVYVGENGSTFVMEGGEISSGVTVRGTFIMNGGTISSGVWIDGYATNSPRKFIMNGGTISRRTTGCGVEVESGCTFTMNGGTISGCKTAKGGGVYNSGNFTMNGGTISGNTATNSGGGIYNDSGGIFTIGGSASLPSATGAAKDNDVYLDSSSTIKISSELSAATPVATITPDVYSTSRQVLELASSSTTTLADNYQKFAVSPDSNGTEWCVTSVGKLRAVSYSIYVSQSGNDTTGNGNPSAPYKTLKKAFDKIKNTGSSTYPYTVYISGTVSGTTTVASGLPAAKVLITGTSSASDILDGNNTGSVLTVNCTAPIEIKNVKITNGSATYGGGINVGSGANVTLGEGAVVSGNKTTGTSGDGGGVYVTGSSTVFTLAGGEISGNTAYNDGGGVCISSGTFIMSSGKISNNSSTGQSGSKNNGGGVMNLSSSGTFTMTGGEISGNTARSGGGGVFTNGTFTMTGGKISSNNAGVNGGGIWNGGRLTMEDGEISGNKADQWGGGIYNKSTYYMKGGTVSGNTASDDSSTNNLWGSKTQTGGTIE